MPARSPSRRSRLRRHVARVRPTRTGVDRRSYTEVLDVCGRAQVVRTDDLDGAAPALLLHDRFGRPYPPPRCVTDAPASMLRSNVAVIVGPLFRESGAAASSVLRARATEEFRARLVGLLQTGAGLLLKEARQAIPGITRALIVGELAQVGAVRRFPLPAHAELAFVLDGPTGQGSVAIAESNALDRAFTTHRISARIGVTSLRVSVFRGACPREGIPLTPIRLRIAA